MPIWTASTSRGANDPSNTAGFVAALRPFVAAIEGEDRTVRVLEVRFIPTADPPSSQGDSPTAVMNLGFGPVSAGGFSGVLGAFSGLSCHDQAQATQPTAPPVKWVHYASNGTTLYTTQPVYIRRRRFSVDKSVQAPITFDLRACPIVLDARATRPELVFWTDVYSGWWSIGATVETD